MQVRVITQWILKFNCSNIALKIKKIITTYVLRKLCLNIALNKVNLNGAINFS